MYSADGVLSSTRQVSPFRHLRIKACLAAPRSLSQPRHVFHRFLAPKHPPNTLRSLTTFILRQTHGLAENKPRSISKCLFGSRYHYQTINFQRAQPHLTLRWETYLSCSGYADIGSLNVPQNLVEMIGIEPTTPALQRQCSPN